MSKRPTSRNNILHNVKRIIGVAYFAPSSVKRGNCMRTRSSLTKSTVLPKRCSLHEKKTQFEREEYSLWKKP